jgi:hypothetical protein
MKSIIASEENKGIYLMIICYQLFNEILWEIFMIFILPFLEMKIISNLMCSTQSGVCLVFYRLSMSSKSSRIKTGHFGKLNYWWNTYNAFEVITCPISVTMMLDGCLSPMPRMNVATQ